MTCSQQRAQGCDVKLLHHLHTEIADTRIRTHMGMCLQRENTKQPAVGNNGFKLVPTFPLDTRASLHMIFFPSTPENTLQLLQRNMES
jgi:hypothetical protein